MKYLIGIFMMLNLMLSCDSSRVYEQFQAIPDFWSQNDTLSFDFKVKETGYYKITFHVRQSSEYRYNNFYYYYFLSSDSVLYDGLNEINFYDSKTGKPLGKGIGDLFDHRDEVLDSIELYPKKNYRFSILQYMRKDSLTTIKRVGLRINTKA